MESRMTERLTSVTDRYQPGPKTATPPANGVHRPDRPLENMRPTKILKRSKPCCATPSKRGQPLSFPLVVAAVILVFLIFALDLILTGL